MYDPNLSGTCLYFCKNYIGVNGDNVYSLDISMDREQTRHASQDSVFRYLIRPVKDKA